MVGFFFVVVVIHFSLQVRPKMPGTSVGQLCLFKYCLSILTTRSLSLLTPAGCLLTRIVCKNVILLVYSWAYSVADQKLLQI